MNDDQLLKALAQVAREDQKADAARLDERWDRLSAGTLEPEEEAALRALAETSDEARQAYEAFRPLDADFRARMVQALADRIDEAPAGAMATPAAEPEPAWARLLDRLQDRWRGASVFAAAVAAAGLAVWMIPGSREGLPPLPDYVLGLEGGLEALRSEPTAGGEDRLFVPGNRFELLLRPATAESGPLAVRFFLAAAGEPPHPLELPVEVSAGGAVRVAGEIGGEIAIEPGDWVLWAVVGRPGAMGDEDEIRAALRESETGARGGRAFLRTAFRIAVEPP